jgi:lipid-binding SYLF domain-containing protein
MMLRRVGFVCLATSALMMAAETKSESVTRIKEAARVFQEINATPDKAIPQEILERAECVGIIPGMKRAGFVVGGSYGVGVVTCRSANNRGWTGPATVRLEGGSFGLQIGAGETDVVFVVMNDEGMNKLMEDKFTIGGGVAAMAGPVGRSASAKTDALMHAQILSYSRSRGVFAGATLEGSTLRPDDAANEVIYGHPVTNRDILTGRVRPPASAQPLYAALNRYMPAKEKTARR